MALTRIYGDEKPHSEAEKNTNTSNECVSIVELNVSMRHQMKMDTINAVEHKTKLDEMAERCQPLDIYQSKCSIERVDTFFFLSLLSLISLKFISVHTSSNMDEEIALEGSIHTLFTFQNLFNFPNLQHQQNGMR